MFELKNNNHKKISLILCLLLIFLSVAITFNTYDSNASGNISVTLNRKAFIYTGNVIKPKVVVKYNNKKLTSSSYTLKYAPGRTNVGKYYIKIKLKGKYKGTKTVYFTINPKKTSIKTLVSGKDNITITWNKISKEVTGYEIEYSTAKSFSSSKKLQSKGTTSVIKGLSDSTKYFVRIRTYKSAKGVKYFSEWSAVKSINTKKAYHFRNEYLLNQHFDKHGREMGFSTAKEYESAASDVVTNPESLHKIEQEDGDDVYYLESTNDIVFVSTDGYIRTYFRPDSGKYYFDKQLKN